MRLSVLGGKERDRQSLENHSAAVCLLFRKTRKGFKAHFASESALLLVFGIILAKLCIWNRSCSQSFRPRSHLGGTSCHMLLYIEGTSFQLCTCEPSEAIADSEINTANLRHLQVPLSHMMSTSRNWPNFMLTPYISAEGSSVQLESLNFELVRNMSLSQFTILMQLARICKLTGWVWRQGVSMCCNFGKDSLGRFVAICWGWLWHWSMFLLSCMH